MKTLNAIKNWGIQYIDNQILITDTHMDTILTLLQNKRLHSELTEEDFDVESLKAVQLGEVSNN